MFATRAIPKLVTLCLLAGVSMSAAPSRAAAQDAPASASFVQTLRQAEAKTAASEWKEAAVLWERIVQANPFEPHFWNELGHAHYKAANHKAAIPAYEKAIELGGPLPAHAAYNIACSHALAGEKELALEALERALAMGYPGLGSTARDEDFKSLRDDSRFKKLLGLTDVSKL